MERELRLKGVNFRGVLQALERRSGGDHVARVLRHVKGPAGDALRHGEVLAGGWYPASWYDALLEGVENAYPGEIGVVRDLAREAIAFDFGTLFKLVSFVITPESALRNAMRVVSRYVDGGRVVVVEAREGHLHFQFEGFYGYTRRMWEDWQGGMEAILDLMKVRRLAPRVLSGGKTGDDRLEVILRYAREKPRVMT